MGSTPRGQGHLPGPERVSFRRAAGAGGGAGGGAPGMSRGRGGAAREGRRRGCSCTCSRGPSGGRCPELLEPGAWEGLGLEGGVRDGRLRRDRGGGGTRGRGGMRGAAGGRMRRVG